jgi:hypothetical protein
MGNSVTQTPEYSCCIGEPLFTDHDVHFGGIGAQHPDGDAVGVRVGAEQLVWLAVGAVDQRCQ